MGNSEKVRALLNEAIELLGVSEVPFPVGIGARAKETVEYGSPVEPDYAGFMSREWWLAHHHGQKYTGPPAFVGQRHPGVDMNSRNDGGKPFYAVANGVIVFAGRGAGANWGYLVILRADDGMEWRYAHGRSIGRFAVMERVTRGMELGTIGGGPSGFDPHLHFEGAKPGYFASKPSRWDGKKLASAMKHYVDPVAYINERGWWQGD